MPLLPHLAREAVEQRAHGGHEREERVCAALVAQVGDLAVDRAHGDAEEARVRTRDLVDGDGARDLSARLCAQRVRNHRVQVRDKGREGGHGELAEERARDDAAAGGVCSGGKRSLSGRGHCRGEDGGDVDTPLQLAHRVCWQGAAGRSELRTGCKDRLPLQAQVKGGMA